jgi:hypothetical protein
MIPDNVSSPLARTSRSEDLEIMRDVQTVTAVLIYIYIYIYICIIYFLSSKQIS